ncbi:MAG TPA: RHS repeat-associated core domain-containing protein [Ignavibacteriaceae bacterium]|nr:RHS repeat-associated core domain-containing protein [Ignavibacteriaceae bacterium]
MYDDNGQRIQKKSGSTGDFYLRDHTGRELAVYDTAFANIKLINLYGADGMIGKVDVSFQYIPHVHPEDGEIYYEVIRSDYKSFYNKDHLGSIRQTIGSNGTVSATYDYSPFGEIIYSYVSNGSDKYKFTQKERDTETNLDYFGARYYDSEIGRWLSPDPLADKYPGWSPYNYCLNISMNRLNGR